MLLGIDVGTTNTKVALVDVRGAVPRAIRVAAAPTPPPAVLGATVGGLVREVCAGAEREVAAVGIASMAETGVPLDPDRRPLGDWLRWDGRRAARQAAALARRLGPRELFAATGVRPSAKVPLATWLWLREVEPDRFRAMAEWSGAADLLGLRLTGVLGTDHTLAGRTMAYRLGPGDPPPGFDASLLAEVGLTPGQLPRVVPPDQVLGGLDAAGAVLTGLRPGTPVVVAGHDHQVGAWAAGVRGPGEAADSLGTAEALIRVVDAAPDPAEVAAAGMSLVRTVSGSTLALVAGASAAGGLIAWWRQRERVDDAVLEAAAALPGPAGPVVLPYPAGRQSPVPDPGAVLRVPDEGDLVTRTRAVLDALCLQARWMADVQSALTGGPATRTVVLGGSAVPAWLSVKQRVGPHPMQVLRAAEPVATGAAVLAARRAGLADPAGLAVEPVAVPADTYAGALDRLVAAATEVRPDPA